jgi:type IX secretion system PorP/SprF family membrane protein
MKANKLNHLNTITMKKIFITAAFTGAFALQASAQQLPLYSQYAFNPFIYNPSMTGIAGETNAFLTHRQQWTQMTGSPTTNAITVDGFMDDKNVGLGLAIFNDVQDINERMGIYTSYAYRLKINDDQQLRFGVSVGFLDNRIDFSRAVVKDVADPLLLSQIQRRAALDATAGVMYSWKELRVGISVPQVVGQKVEFSTTDARTYYQLNRHFLGSVGYKYVINEEQKIALEPLAMVRWLPNTPFQYDVNVMASWRDMIWLGASYRSNYAVGANLRVKLFGNLSAGYAYDFIITPLRTSAGISHEFMLGYTFGKMASSGTTTTTGPLRGKYD